MINFELHLTFKSIVINNFIVRVRNVFQSKTMQVACNVIVCNQ